MSDVAASSWPGQFWSEGLLSPQSDGRCDMRNPKVAQPALVAVRSKVNLFAACAMIINLERPQRVLLPGRKPLGQLHTNSIRLDDRCLANKRKKKNGHTINLPSRRLKGHAVIRMPSMKGSAATIRQTRRAYLLLRRHGNSAIGSSTG